MFRNFFPGLGTAVVAFAIYVIVDETILKPKEKPHEETAHH